MNVTKNIINNYTRRLHTGILCVSTQQEEMCPSVNKGQTPTTVLVRI